MSRLGRSNRLLAFFLSTRVVRAAIRFLGLILYHLAAIFGGSAFDNGALRVGGSGLGGFGKNSDCPLFHMSFTTGRHISEEAFVDHILLDVLGRTQHLASTHLAPYHMDTMHRIVP